ncbi:DNA polymerase alpha-associated DNA helicase A [Schizosaccharomyces cryophilus OY26]|uniref:DNA helicase n=1 Tax=Schizosaccharomyces cryophilus (strain OY26 / ATCC MYA-4695 / CBS 11777 / NBRC 106824 / NRRL Y48691) TaxID=653667 RepID=S9VTV0_SCHCR|nr:DNA polymerase alpha-associated DNA helicase A [Schizosaccharomyces cryophilus OY26]EPY51293.1 DNA polymerase alpha-associated DNA helicase A [Schizosaccharomyces cryophilus OY26]
MSEEAWIEEYSEKELKFIEEIQKIEIEEAEAVLKKYPLPTLQKNGIALVNLRLSSIRTGFGGKTVIELERDPAFSNSDTLPANSFSPGDVVRLNQGGGKSDIRASKSVGKNSKQTDPSTEGVITRVQEKSVSIALNLEEDAPPMAEGLSIVKLANRITYERMKDTMIEWRKNLPQYRMPLFYTLTGKKEANTNLAEDMINELTFYNNELNDSQKKAVRFSLGVQELALIHGPPGTGKTHTLVEVIRQLVAKGKRVLVCGASNLSVDNIVDRISHYGIPMVRLGHPARLLPSVLNHSLDVISRSGDFGEVVNGISEDIDTELNKIRKTKSGKERREIYKHVRELRKDYRRYEAQNVSGCLRKSSIVFCTLHGAGSRQLRNETFDVVIIDEASQALEAQCWIPLLGAKKAILAGDHMQLSPNVQTKKPYLSMFERLLKIQGDKVKCFLNVQYRMHELINKFPSDTFYDGKLIPAPEVAKRVLMDLPYVEETELTDAPIYFYDTDGNYQEDDPKDMGTSLYRDSKSNKWEAQIVCHHVTELLGAGLKEEDMAIVTPYNAQVALIRSMLKLRGIEIEMGSVDRVQGREKEAIIFSLVRSNDFREVGFLAEKKRLNVAITRPKRHLCVVGDGNTVKWTSDFFQRWMNFLEGEAIVLEVEPSILE